MAGYSVTPLIKKLGFKPLMRVSFSAPPRNWQETLGPLPDGVKVQKRPRPPIDLAVAFCLTLRELRAAYKRYRPRLEKSGMLWIAWPKKSSGVASELNENLIRDLGLAAKLVDVKVCAIDDVWSGLKFVIPVKLR